MPVLYATAGSGLDLSTAAALGGPGGPAATAGVEGDAYGSIGWALLLARATRSGGARRVGLSAGGRGSGGFLASSFFGSGFFASGFRAAASGSAARGASIFAGFAPDASAVAFGAGAALAVDVALDGAETAVDGVEGALDADAGLGVAAAPLGGGDAAFGTAAGPVDGADALLDTAAAPVDDTGGAPGTGDGAFVAVDGLGSVFVGAVWVVPPAGAA